jgi:hypothetical protein
MIACLLSAFAAASAAAADGPLDQQIILLGRDEAALPLPEPWHPPGFAFPEPDMKRPETPFSPLAAPPLGEWADLLPEAGYTYVGCAGAPPGRWGREVCAGGTGGMETHSV